VRLKGHLVDFLVLPNIVVEVTGSAHLKSVRHTRDLMEIQDLQALGYKMVIIPNHMLLADDANEAVLYKIKNA
jgi:very-short-patch-repair endonuclease